jgi:hypothetical protein
MTTRNEYKLKLTINERSIRRVIIDQHYQSKHAKSISDELILELVRSIDGEVFAIQAESKGFEYFAAELNHSDKKMYRLVLVLYIHDDYLGVINAFRIRKKK